MDAMKFGWMDLSFTLSEAVDVRLLLSCSEEAIKSAVLESLHVSAEATIKARALLLLFYFSYCPRNLQTPSNGSSYKSTAFLSLLKMKPAAFTLFFCAHIAKRTHKVISCLVIGFWGLEDEWNQVCRWVLCMSAYYQRNLLELSLSSTESLFCKQLVVK